jgi:lipopolysaccharide heptosyltransferase I
MRILLIRTSAIGDVVHCLPVLTALRRHLPGARIGWVIEEAMAPLLQGHPDLDELLVVRLREWRRRPLAAATVRGIKQYLGDLRRFAPEVVIDLMGNHKAGVLAGLSLCDRIIGAARADRRERSSAIWINQPVHPRGVHAVDRALSLLEPLGIVETQADFGGDKLFPPPAPADLPERFFLIHPGAAWPNKRYPPDSWGAVARRLGEASGLPGLITAGPAEGDLVEAARRASRGALRPVASPDIGALAHLLRSAELVLAGDTGPLHLAHALGTPVLAVLGPTAPASHGPHGHPEAAIWHELPCSFCHKRLEEPKACLTLISPAEVAGRAAALLGL